MKEAFCGLVLLVCSAIAMVFVNKTYDIKIENVDRESLRISCEARGGVLIPNGHICVKELLP